MTISVEQIVSTFAPRVRNPMPVRQAMLVIDQLLWQSQHRVAIILDHLDKLAPGASGRGHTPDESANVELMQRFIDLLGRTPHRVIVSMGPQHTELRLADNMWGAELVPQPAILPLVDLVITHGGNNTVTECFHFGKPMVVLPLFWDQYDNAQRVDELGFGVRLRTYGFEDAELRGAVDRLIAAASRVTPAPR